MSDYLSYYVESTIICLVIFGIMLGNDFMNTDRQEKQIKLAKLEEAEDFAELDDDGKEEESND